MITSHCSKSPPARLWGPKLECRSRDWRAYLLVSQQVPYRSHPTMESLRELGVLLAGLDGSRQTVQNLSQWVVAHPALAAESARALRKATPRAPAGALWVLFVMHDVMAQIAGAGETYSALWAALRFQLPAAVADAIAAGGDWTTVSRLIGAWRDAGHLGAHAIAMLEMAVSTPHATPRPPSPPEAIPGVRVLAAAASSHAGPQWGAAPSPFAGSSWHHSGPYESQPTGHQVAPAPQAQFAGVPLGPPSAHSLPSIPGGHWQGLPPTGAWSQLQGQQQWAPPPPQQQPWAPQHSQQQGYPLSQQWAPQPHQFYPPSQQQQQWAPQPPPQGQPQQQIYPPPPAQTSSPAPATAPASLSGSRWGAPPALAPPAPAAAASGGGAVSAALVALEAAKAAAAAAAARTSAPPATTSARFPVSAGLASSLRGGGAGGGGPSSPLLETGPVGLLVAVMKAQAALRAAQANAVDAAAAAAAAGDGSAAAAAALAASCAPTAAPRYGPVDAASVAAAAAASSKPPPVEPGRLAARLAEFTRAAARLLAEEEARPEGGARRGGGGGRGRRAASPSPSRGGAG